MFGHLIAERSSVPWDWLSGAGKWLFVAFGMLFWIYCVFSLLCLGMRTLFSGRYEQKKHKRREQDKHYSERRIALNILRRASKGILGLPRHFGHDVRLKLTRRIRGNGIRD